MDVCVITGTSTGIGMTAALHFARNRFKVYGTMRNTAKGDALRQAAAAEGLAVEIRQLDVTDRASIERAVAGVLDAEGRIDVLVNNAGLSNACPVELYPEDEHRAMFETNYWGPVHLTQAVLPAMRAQSAGAIVNVSSILGRMAVVNQAAYCATKYAVEAFSESLALEVAPLGIRVVIIEPGVIATPIFTNTPVHYDKASPYVRAMRQGGRFYRAMIPQATPPERIAEAMVEAVTTDRPRLRWMTGIGSEMVAARPAISDEDYVALSGLDDDAYNARFQELFGLDISKR